MAQLFLNRDAAKIVGITQRQVLGWTEKGLVVPSKDTFGAGIKREYDYVNLLELGLVKRLFFIGFGFQAIKKILADLRGRNTVRDWANNFSDYHRQSFERHKKRLRRALENPDSFSEKALPKDPKGSLEKLEKSGPFKPETPGGVLLYFFGKDDSYTWVVPYEKREVLDINLVKGYLAEPYDAIIIDLGRIKNEIDQAI